eukprot:gnl/MRDRNA2_/MRDRNA2_99676_c0_seq1.p1 gnl/MRDRNA2_/MRDRNA2_99676_c0~~gnl/MRDRNA2_/MRDRNA2_99676_c0_seq1.p1  ORF type:complete len:331 (-),score=86.41 gnl/MRDRNA2_/MRDRNA2_99676_c0_seq1:5-997(-)
MFFIRRIVLLAVAVLQTVEGKPAVVDWYLKKKDKEAKPAKVNQNVRAFRAKQKLNTHDHEKEWAKTVAEVEGDDAPKMKYGKKTTYTPAPTLAKPEPKEVKAAKKPAAKEAPVAKTQNGHKFEVKPVAKHQPVAKQQPVTTAAAHATTSLHNTAHLSAGSKSQSGSKDKAHQSHKKAHAGPAGMPGPAPAPAPAPAPLNYEQRVSKLKGDMMAKIKGDSFDADFVIERPNKVKPGTSTGQEVPVGDFKDVGGDFGPYAPAAAPLKHDDISFKTGSLPVDAAHVDRQTMTSDWHMEYGPNGPKGIHGARPWYRPWPANHGTQFQPLQIGGL